MGALGGEDEQRACLVVGQPGDVGAVAGQQPYTAAASALRPHRDAGGGQRLDVAVDGADGDLQVLGELDVGDPFAGLQEQQDGQQSVGFHTSERKS